MAAARARVDRRRWLRPGRLVALLAAERRALDRDPGGWLAAAPAKTDS